MKNMLWIRDGYKFGLQDAKVLGGSYRNFAGEKRQYNDAGKRNFNVIIEPENIEELERCGVRIKYFPKSEEDDPSAIPTAFAKVNISYDSKNPPYIERVTDKWRQEIKPEKLYTLDGATFENVDLVINIYKTGTLWLQDGHFKLVEDPITSKYEDIPLLSDDPDDEEAPF